MDRVRRPALRHPRETMAALDRARAAPACTSTARSTWPGCSRRSTCRCGSARSARGCVREDIVDLRFLSFLHAERASALPMRRRRCLISRSRSHARLRRRRPAPQEAYPSKAAAHHRARPAPGTSPDLLARMIAQHLAPALGQQIVIVNQPGGGGNIGHGTAAKRDAGRLHAARDERPALDQRDRCSQAAVSCGQELRARRAGDRLAAGADRLTRGCRSRTSRGAGRVRARPIRARSISARRRSAPSVISPASCSSARRKSTSCTCRSRAPPRRSRRSSAGKIQMLFVTLPPAIGQIQAGRGARARGEHARARERASRPCRRCSEFGTKEFDFGAWQGVLVPAGTPRGDRRAAEPRHQRRPEGTRGERPRSSSSASRRSAARPSSSAS